MLCALCGHPQKPRTDGQHDMTGGATIADPGDCINSYRYLCIQCGKPRQSSHHDVMKLVNMNMGILTASTPPRESPIMSTLNSIGATGRKPNVSDQKGRYLHDSNLRQELKRKYAATGPRAENTMAERTEARCRSRERGGSTHVPVASHRTSTQHSISGILLNSVFTYVHNHHNQPTRKNRTAPETRFRKDVLGDCVDSLATVFARRKRRHLVGLDGSGSLIRI